MVIREVPPRMTPIQFLRELEKRNLLDAVPTSETLLDAGVRVRCPSDINKQFSRSGMSSEKCLCIYRGSEGGEGRRGRLGEIYQKGIPYTNRGAYKKDTLKASGSREFNEEEQRLNLDLQQERREAAAIREARYKSKMEQYYNKKVRLAGFRPGEFVYRRNEASRVGIKGSWVPSGKAHTRYDELKNGSFNVANGWGQDSSGLALRLNLRKSRTPNFNGESNFPMNDCYNLGYGKSNRTTKSTGP
ncbi:hypothetical protein Tco_0280376 [Tanacetum coccineum]